MSDFVILDETGRGDPEVSRDVVCDIKRPAGIFGDRADSYQVLLCFKQQLDVLRGPDGFPGGTIERHRPILLNRHGRSLCPTGFVRYMEFPGHF